MVTVEQPCYTLINLPSDADPPNEMQLKIDLEKGDIKTKIEALKKTIHMIVSGERLPGLLMTIIRFVLPLQDHMIKKLLLIFWEIVPKTTPDGKLMQEMILVCDSYRKDLQHPNEFLRGSTLRFLCKLKEPELLEPLMPAIRACLEHRHSYVRRNAVLAIFTIYRNFEFLIPDAPELIASFLEGEQDMSCKRNAFLMLLHADQERALAYLASCLDQVTSFGDILQLVIVELIYKVCHANPSERSRFIRCIYNLLNSTSQAVRYEAAGTLVTLSSAPTAIKAAASCYIELIVKESDNNVKLIVLDRLIALKEHPTHERVLQDLVMDILRVLASPDLEVRKKTLNLAMELVSSRNIEEMVLVLKKEVAKTHNVVEHEDTGKYRQLLVRTLHSCCIKFPDVAATVIPVLIEFLSDTNELAASDVLVFVREAIQKFETLRPLIIERLLDAFPTIKSVKVHRAALWILGEYATSPDDIQAVMNQVRQTLGEIPLVDDEIRRATGEKVEEDTTQQQAPVQKLVTSDGTYATQSAFNTASVSKKGEARPPLRQYMMDGDFFIGAALGTTLAKLALRYMSLTSDSKKQNRFCSEAMLIMASILHLGKSGLATKNMTNDDADRLYLCLRVLSDKSPVIVNIFNENCRRALSIMLAAKAEEEASTQKAKEKPGSMVQADDPISFLQLSSTRGGELGGTENVFELSLNQAVVGGRRDGIGSGLGGTGEMTPGLSKLNKVTQLTGFSDPVYAEAYVHVNQYDIVLDVLIVNQTGDTLQNCTLELATLGDLKLVEKPQPVVLAPRDFCNIKANVKVASTENGIIFGNIVYDVSGAASDRNVVVLNDIHIDIMDYIVPASCNDTEFRQMWAEFEWENKISVNTNLTDLHEYLKHLISSTNMKCLTPEKVFERVLFRASVHTHHQSSSAPYGSTSPGSKMQIEMDVTSSRSSLSFDTYNYQYTRGIDVQQVSVSGVGDLTLWEFSGQDTYFLVYDHFIGSTNCLNVVVFNLEDSPSVQYQQCCFWLAFLQARIPPTEPLGDRGVASRIARVLLVATHPDTSRTPRTPQGNYISSQAERLLAQLIDKYGNLFDLHQQILVVDAHVSNSPGIKAVKSYLADAKQKVLQGVPKWTGFLDGVVNWLPSVRRNSSSFPVVPWFTFVDLVHCNVNPLAGEEHMKELIQQLQLMGEVVYLKSQYQDLVCLTPNWLCSNVIGQLLSLDFVAQARVTGCYTVDDFQVAFSDCDALDVLQVLEALQLCTQCENDDELEFEFPCYNFVETLDGLWDASDPRYHDPDSCYGGVKLKTPLDTFHLIHSIFPRIQVQLRRTMQSLGDPDSDLYQWFEGSKLCSGLIESLITLEEDGEAIEMKVRGPPGSELACFYFMEELLGIVDQVLLEMSPGLPIEKHVLSAEQLRLHSDLVHCWTPDELMASILQPPCLNANLFNPLTGNYESVLDLVGFGAPEVSELVLSGDDLPVTALSTVCRQQLSKLLDPPDPLGKDWCLLAVQLGLADKIAALDSGGNTISRTAKLLDEWAKDKASGIGMLIRKLQDLGREDVAKILLRSAPLYRIVPTPVHQDSPSNVSHNSCSNLSR